MKQKMMAKSLKLVIFDCDGTLVDSQHMILRAMREAYAAHRLPVPDRETLLSGIGLSLPQLFAKLGQGIADFPVASMCDAYRASFQTMRAAQMDHLEPLYPGAATTVAALSQRENVLLGIATGKSQRGVRGVLTRYGLIDHFITIKTADDAPSKPDPGMVLSAMHEAGVTPRDTVVVGDTVFDIMMARAAGASAIGVAWGYHSRDSLRETGATVIDDFAHLEPALDKLWTL
jgi:phosphoglycolate phosphatase